ncbi:hypothetical protein ACF3NG_01430 [Aerococcaceae bacterium WGS1372]
MKNKMVKVAFPASCGELVQGKIGNERFLCSYAIDCYSNVTVQTKQNQNNHKLGDKSKSLISVLKAMNETIHVEWDKVEVIIDNDIPYEKGMGSSTADLAGLSIALFEFFDVEWNSDIIAKLLTRVEATDSLVYPSLTLMNPDNGESFQRFIQDKYYSVACLIPDQAMNTVTLLSAYTERKWDTKAYTALLSDTVQAFNTQSIDNLIVVAEQSARLNDTILPKPFLEELLLLKATDGVIGVNVSHTGTVIGVIYDESIIAKENVTSLIRTLDSDCYYQIEHHRMIPSTPIIKSVIYD